MSDRPLFEVAFEKLAGGLERGETWSKVDGHRPARKLRQDPIMWAESRLGVSPETLKWTLAAPAKYAVHSWDGTEDPIALMMKEVAAGNDVGVESATGTGKTFAAAVMAMWFLDCYENSQIVTMAPKEKQLELNMWKEIAKLFPAFKRHRPNADLQHLRLRMTVGSDLWAIHGFACGVGADEQVAQKAAGFHAEHMLFILEECPGIHPAILAAVENTCTAPHNVRMAIGNPDHTMDALHQFCEGPGVKHLRISGLDHPNVVADNPNIVPGAVSKPALERRLAKYGDEGSLWLSRGRGICPAQATDAIMHLVWCQAAARRAEDPDARARIGATFGGKRALGVDVANSESGDEASIAAGTGGVLRYVKTWPSPDANAFVRLHVQPLILSDEIDDMQVGVDAVGVGAGAVNELRRLGYKGISALQSASTPIFKPREEEEFLNLRAQMWWTLRMDLFHGRVILPNDMELFQDLCTPKWGTRGGKIFIERKEDLRKRLGRSPNKGDAAVYWNWVRQNRLGVSRGGATATL